MKMSQTLFFIILLFYYSYCNRYGNNDDYCIDGTFAEKSKSGVTKWCTNSEECSNGWKCVPTAQFHFSRQINYCCQMRESICSMPPNPGYGDCFEEPKTMFYFDSIDLKCKQFKVINCHGRNQNQFESMELCTRFCQSTACSAGQSLLLSRDGSPLYCKDHNCPSGYTCVYDKLFNKHVCCGHSPTGVCPIGSISYSHIKTNQAMRCTPSTYQDTCPIDYVCTTQGQHNYCCSPHDAICPAGQRSYIHVVSNKTMKCNPMETSACPEKYYCSPAVPGAQWGFCCSSHIEASCPEYTKPFLDSSSKQPIRCTVGVTQCNVGYSCQNSNSKSLIGFCCTKPKIKVKMSMPDTTSPTINQNLIETTPNPSEYHFVHNEGLIGPRTQNQNKKIIIKPFQKTVEPSTFGGSLYYKPAMCPPQSASVHYENTQITVECTPALGYNIECPGGSECTNAYMDLSDRMVCCIMPKTTPIPTFTYYVTSVPKMIRYRTSDSYCPYAIRNKSCHPSNPSCPMGYFCQYLIDSESFSCCSLY